MPIKRKKSLEIESEAFNQNSNFWRAQKIIFALFTLLLFAVLLGIAGPGIFGWQVAGKKESGFWIQYNLFNRRQANDEIRVNINPSQMNKTPEITLSVSTEYLANNYIKQITPQPTTTEQLSDQTIYHYNINGYKPITITILLEPQIAGKFHPTFKLGTGQTVTFNQYTYP